MEKDSPALCGEDNRQKRSSNFELLRILTMLCIIAHHYVVNSGITEKITQSNVLQWNSVFALIFGWGGKTGINVFVLITGYFMCKSKISLKKFLGIFFEIEFYEIVFYVFFISVGYESFSLKVFIRTICFPIYDIGYGFCGSYLVFFLFIPYINLLIKNMDEKQHLSLVGLCLLVGMIFQTFLKAPSAFTYVGWFIVLYFISSYFRLHLDGEYDNKWLRDIFSHKKVWRYAVIFSLMLSWVSVVAGAAVYHLLGENLIYYFVADSNKFLAVITAICLFQFFRNIEMGCNKVINMIARSTFGVLLLHANSEMMMRWLWQDLFNNVKAYQTGTENMGYFMFHAFGTVIIIYCICTIIDMIRIKFIEYLFSRKIVLKWRGNL